MKLALIGLGTVGNAMRVWLEKHTKHQLVLHDPYKGHTATSFFGVDAAFVAVPVPTMPDRRLDLSILKRAVALTDDCPVFVRSTLLPGALASSGIYPGRHVIPMPEFLTARYAVEDFERLPLVVGSKLPVISELMTEAFPGKRVMQVEPDVACLGKHAHNLFGAKKVNFSNIVAAAARHLEVDYEQVIRVANVTGFLGSEHLKVPGPDGRYGYGGACLAKDVAAIIGFLRDNGIRGAGTIASCEHDNALFRSEEAGSWTRL